MKTRRQIENSNFSEMQRSFCRCAIHTHAYDECSGSWKLHNFESAYTTSDIFMTKKKTSHSFSLNVSISRSTFLFHYISRNIHEYVLVVVVTGGKLYSFHRMLSIEILWNMRTYFYFLTLLYCATPTSKMDRHNYATEGIKVGRLSPIYYLFSSYERICRDFRCLLCEYGCRTNKYV